MNKIYTYTDYRKFVKDYYLSKKKSIRRFSYRSFSEKAGFSSPNFIKLVIDGKKKSRKRERFQTLQGYGAQEKGG